MSITEDYSKNDNLINTRIEYFKEIIKPHKLKEKILNFKGYKTYKIIYIYSSI